MQIVKLYARSMSKDLPKLKSWEMQEKQCKNLLKVSFYDDDNAIFSATTNKYNYSKKNTANFTGGGGRRERPCPIHDRQVAESASPITFTVLEISLYLCLAD